jgi:hypothetical protein
MATRNGFRWTVNESLQLQREFELLKLTIDEIATKHKRTPNAIMYKLDQEGLADYNTLYETETLKFKNDDDGTDDETEDGDDDESEDEDGDDDESEDEDEDEDGDDDETKDGDDEDVVVNTTDIKTIKNQMDKLQSQMSMIMDMMLKLSDSKKSLFSVFS